MRTPISLVLALTVALPALAVDPKVQLTGADFSSACTRASESWVSFCNGYVQAVIDGLRQEDRVCFPAGTTRTEIVTVVEKEITSSTELREINAHNAVRAVLFREFPCN